MKHAAQLFFVVAICRLISPTAVIAQHISLKYDENTPEERQLIDAILQGDIAKTKLITRTVKGDFDDVVSVWVFDSPSADVVEYLRKKHKLSISDLQIAAIRGDAMAIGHLLGQLDKVARAKALAQGLRPVVGSSQSALILAVRNGHTDAVRKLIELGADVHEIARYTPTPLATAAERGHTDIVKVLLDSGVNVNAIAEKKDNAGDAPYTALMRACIGGQAKSVRILLESGADANMKREDGQRALHFAAARGDLECVKLLLNYGADVRAKDRFERTPLSCAQWFGRKQIAALLKSTNDK